jgi:catechol 2,3-dioxygenase-like lactoylglutathione lyase family enzyme
MTVGELRLVVTADDFDRALAFYRDVLGLPVVADYSSPDGRALLLDAGRARLELFDRRQAEHVDRVEVGRRVAGPVRVAFEVHDTAAVTQAAASAGAEVLAAPTRTPWGSLNARLAAPADLQLTLFSDEPAG